MSPTCFEIVARHTRVLYSCPRLMISYFEEAGLSMNLENIVKLGRLTFFEIVARPSAWHLYSFLTQIFLLYVVLEKEYMKYDVEKIVSIVS